MPRIIRRPGKQKSIKLGADAARAEPTYNSYAIRFLDFTARYNAAASTPGTAEFLSTLLSKEHNYGCPHPSKLSSGLNSRIPSRLGYFHTFDDELSFIDTEKLCIACYARAVPDGFLTWSTMYFRPDVATILKPGMNYPSAEPCRGNETWFPRQLQAGTEMFVEDAAPEPPSLSRLPPQTDSYSTASLSKALEILGHHDFDPRRYEIRGVSIPQSPETVECWKLLRHAMKPFYIDLLHLTPPWREFTEHEFPNSREREDLQMQENARVAHANGAAYLGAKWVVTGVPHGGSGPYTASEHRIAEHYGHRLVEIGLYQLFEDTGAEDHTSRPSSSSSDLSFRVMRTVSHTGPDAKVLADAINSENLPALEVDPRFYGPDLGRTYFRPGSFLFYPPESKVDSVTRNAIGNELAPTNAERARRRHEQRLPEVPHVSLPRDSRSSSLQTPPTPLSISPWAEPHPFYREIPYTSQLPPVLSTSRVFHSKLRPNKGARPAHIAGHRFRKRFDQARTSSDSMAYAVNAEGYVGPKGTNQRSWRMQAKPPVWNLGDWVPKTSELLPLADPTEPFWPDPTTPEMMEPVEPNTKVSPILPSRLSEWKTAERRRNAKFLVDIQAGQTLYKILSQNRDAEWYNIMHFHDGLSMEEGWRQANAKWEEAEKYRDEEVAKHARNSKREYDEDLQRSIRKWDDFGSQRLVELNDDETEDPGNENGNYWNSTKAPVSVWAARARGVENHQRRQIRAKMVGGGLSAGVINTISLPSFVREFRAPKLLPKSI